MGGPYQYKKQFDSETTGSHYDAIVGETCLPVGSYTFTIYDAKGDGICCDYGRGEYGINLSKGRVIRPLSSGKFTGASQATPFEVSEADIDVFPASYSPGDTDTVVDPQVALPPADTDTVVDPQVASPPPLDSNTSDSETNVNTLDQSATSLEDSAEGTPVTVSAKPPTTSVNSLTSLVTVPSDGVTTGRGKSYGILFDVEVKGEASSVVISGMDMYLDTTSTHYEVWTKQGSWQDVDNVNNPEYFAGFRYIAHGSITGKGASDFTKIPLSDFKDVEIQGGHRQAFYVTLNDDNLVFQSYEGEGISRHEMASVVQAEQDDLVIYYGAAVREYPLSLADPMTDMWFNAGFLGRLWHKNGPGGAGEADHPEAMGDLEEIEGDPIVGEGWGAGP